MKFYLSISQLLQAAESLEGNLGLLAEQALRISPRDSLANREVLGQSAGKVGEARKNLEKNLRLSKTALRHAELLFRIFNLSFQRMIHLASAASKAEQDREDYGPDLLQLFFGANRHFESLRAILAGLSCTPPALEIGGSPEKPDSLLDIFQKDETDRRELMGLLDKALEFFGEERELTYSLQLIRQDLFEAKRKMRRLAPAQPSAKTALASPALASK